MIFGSHFSKKVVPPPVPSRQTTLCFDAGGALDIEDLQAQTSPAYPRLFVGLYIGEVVILDEAC